MKYKLAINNTAVHPMSMDDKIKKIVVMLFISSQKVAHLAYAMVLTTPKTHKIIASTKIDSQRSQKR